MERKYEFTKETVNVNGVTLHRIQAIKDFGIVKKGDLGGFIEKEYNLSHDGDARVYGNARAYDDAKVCRYARVYGDALVCGNAQVFGNAEVYGNARVYDYARVYGNARVYDDTEVCGNAWVCDDAKVYGDAWVYGDARVYGNAEVSCNSDYVCIKGLGSINRNTTFFRSKDDKIMVSCGCFKGDLDEFENRVKTTHGQSEGSKKYLAEYLACINVVKIHFGIDKIIYLPLTI